MTDPSRSTTSLSHRSSSAFAPASRPPNSYSSSSNNNSVRPRNRRLLSTLESDDAVDDRNSRSRSGASTPTRGYGLLSALSPANSRSNSPHPSTRSGPGLNRNPSSNNLSNFFNDSLSQSWASVQGFASSLIAADDGPVQGRRSQSTTRAASQTRTRRRNGSSARKTVDAWGPAPPEETPSMNDVAAGSRAEREAALKAAKRARVLESHSGVNGGLDVSGRHKRRNSNEAPPEDRPPEEYLVYVHKVQPSDTYAGLILRYQCREDAFRKANGLWSRDSVQMRKWLTVPVDACEIRGRPCDPPSWHNDNKVDLLARTPGPEDESSGSQHHDDFFSRLNGTSSEPKPVEEEEKPWAHVRWVKIDTFQQPVEIGRVARNAMGYFPPRRKKSIRTISTFSTPRQSFDLSSNPPASAEGTTSRRTSSLSFKPQFSASLLSSPGRAISEGGESLPAFMRRPGGVGSMGSNARAPGPDRDALNTWTKKHIPGLNIDNLPSMSIMGSETAHFGFKPETGGLVENHVAEGRDANSTTTQQGSGLDRAAAAVETWLRGALTRNPSSNFGGLRGQPGGDGDLIELADTGSEDGRTQGVPPTTLMEALSMGAVGSGRSEGEGAVRGRTVKGGKDD